MADDWAWNEALGARLQDRRRIRTLARVLTVLLCAHGRSWSEALGSGLRQSAGDLVGLAAIGYQDVMAGHYQATAERCLEHQVILISQDTTWFNFDGLRFCQGLGKLGNKHGTRGMWAHSALAMTADGQPLGVLQLQLRTRHGAGRKAKARRQRPYRSKASYRWEETVHQATAWVQRWQRVVVLADREADIFEYLQMARRPGVELLVRASQPRRCEDADGRCVGKVTDCLDGQPAVGSYTIVVKGQPRVLEVRYRRVWVLSPRSWRKAAQCRVPLTVVEAREASPPAGQKALRWLLLTTLELHDVAGAMEVVADYHQRWLVEIQHANLKSKGFDVETLQMRSVEALEKAIAITYITVWRAMHLAYVARENPDEPAVEYFEADELAVLQLHAGRPLATVQEAVWELARIGGWPGYTSSKPPGPESVEVGLRELRSMVKGYRLRARRMLQ